jgi:ribosome recycling factor
MEEEVQMLLDEAKDSNDKSINHLVAELEKVRAGKATPSMLDSVQVEYYGAMTPLSQVANVNTMDARTITVQPALAICFPSQMEKRSMVQTWNRLVSTTAFL